MKKVFITSLIFLVITLFIFGIYNFAFKKEGVDTQASKTFQQEAQPQKVAVVATEKKHEKITLISKDPVVGATCDRKTEKVFYFSSLNGNIWQVDSDGSNALQVTNERIVGLVGASWSSDKTKVLTTINKDEKKVFFAHDNEKKVGTQLKDGIDIVTWDTLGAKIIYKYYDSKSKIRSLSVANPDGSNWQTIVDQIPFRKISISAIPRTSYVSFWNFPDAKEESSLQVVSVAGGEVRNVFKGRFGADYLWSPDGSLALLSSLANKDSGTVSLGTVDMQGQYRDLNIPTIASKCVWSFDNKTIYCALPGDIPIGSVMPNDYQDKKFTTKDTFWKIDTSTGSKQRIVELSDIKDNYDVSEPFLTPAEDALFFTNMIDGKLYRIAL